MHRTRTAVRGSNRTVRVRSESSSSSSSSGSSSALEFEFENYPINLAGIECLSGSPSIFFVIRNQL